MIKLKDTGYNYNYDTGDLSMKIKTGIQFDFHIRGRITQITGDSATGKSFFVNMLSAVLKTGIFNKGDICVFNSEFSINDLIPLKNKLIVIDRGDMFVTPDIGDYIRVDRDNKYLIFARGNLNLYLSPNYFGELETNGNIISIKYKFSERGWF